jgi:hypothetical protein
METGQRYSTLSASGVAVTLPSLPVGMAKSWGIVLLEGFSKIDAAVIDNRADEARAI